MWTGRTHGQVEAGHINLIGGLVTRNPPKNGRSFTCLFIWGFYVTFNTVQVISRRVVGRAEETSTYSWSRFCTVNCQPTESNYQLSHFK